jgi:hypothetical protein
MVFKDRKDRGDIGELIFYKALLLGIIPNSGGIKEFKVLPYEHPDHKKSVQYNLVNGDFGFLGLNQEDFTVDVKCSDEVSERCLNNLKDGSFIFLNAYPNKKTTGLPFMFKVDFFVKNWIKKNCEISRLDDNGKPLYRILYNELITILPPNYEYKFDVDEFKKHRTQCLIDLGILLP